MSVLFNEIDDFACEVLRTHFGATVLHKSIKDVTGVELDGYERVHFFAGGGLWEIACRMAGWAGPIWTGSCPCQPFSVAGKRGGTDDVRHLWPDFFRLIRECRPPVVVGEQVAGAAGYAWFDGVAADLEGEGYACRAVDIPACAVDAPHRRQRLYWVAMADADGRHTEAERLQRSGQQRQPAKIRDDPGAERNAERPEIAMADASHQQRERHDDRDEASWPRSNDQDADVAMADADDRRHRGRPEDPQRGAQRRDAAERVDVEWLQCADGKARRVPSAESYFRDVVDGLPFDARWFDPARLLVPSFKGRNHAWRLAGNAIVAPLAAEVLQALMEVI